MSLCWLSPRFHSSPCDLVFQFFQLLNLRVFRFTLFFASELLPLPGSLTPDSCFLWPPPLVNPSEVAGLQGTALNFSVAPLPKPCLGFPAVYWGSSQSPLHCPFCAEPHSFCRPPQHFALVHGLAPALVTKRGPCHPQRFSQGRSVLPSEASAIPHRSLFPL